MLKNKIIFITGSSRGIGAATARVAANYGATVILHGSSESDGLLGLSKELGVRFYTCDVSDAGAVKEVVDRAVADHGGIDVLINCAGAANRKRFDEASDDDWLDMFKVNVLGTAHFCRSVIPYMQQKNYGRIVNIASIRGFGITSGRPGYSVAKAGIVNLTCALAKEYAPNIAVNAVAPGFTETDMSKTWDEKVWAQVRSSLVGRVGSPSEIAEAILFLASDKASFITGQTIIVDGGYSISGK